MRLTLEAAKLKYGDIVDGSWKDESKWCVLYQVPQGFDGWINSATGKPVERIYINREVVTALEEALTMVKTRGLSDQLKTFDGCFIVRSVRGDPSSLSCHSYACAIDINASTNKLGETPSMSAELVQCFTDAGFSWGGNFHRKDGMHFSLGWE